MGRTNGTKNWTKGEVQILLRMAKDGVSVNDISDSIGRSTSAVYSKLSSIRSAVGTPLRRKAAAEMPAATDATTNTIQRTAKQAEEAPVISTFSNEQQEEIAKIVISAMTDALRFAREKIVAERQAKKKRGFFSRVFGSKHD